MTAVTWFAVGWVCCAVYNAFLPTARRFYRELGCSSTLTTLNSYLWPATVPLTIFILACHRIILGKDAP